MNSDIYNIDLYSILNIQKDASTTDIKKKYRELSKKYHPDKGGNEKVFELITRAYSVLSDQKLRIEYDDNHIKYLEERERLSFVSLKNKFSKYMDELHLNPDKSINENDKNKNFTKLNEDLDRKHNFDRSQSKNVLSSSDMKKKLKELEYSREQDDIETDNPIFNSMNFNLKKFHEAFDTLNDKRGNTDIVEHKEPVAWNSSQLVNGATFDSSTYNDIYVEDDFVGNSICSNISKTNFEIKHEDINKLNNVDYEKKLQEYIKERQLPII